MEGCIAICLLSRKYSNLKQHMCDDDASPWVDASTDVISSRAYVFPSRTSRIGSDHLMHVCVIQIGNNLSLALNNNEAAILVRSVIVRPRSYSLWTPCDQSKSIIIIGIVPENSEICNLSVLVYRYNN